MEWKQRTSVWEYDEFDSPLEKIAKIRGIEDMDNFLNPQKDSLHNPRLLKNIDIASERIVRAIQNNEKICISMDCDVDGITSGVVLYRYLKNYTDNVTYIYGERSYGHGIECQLNSYLIEDTDDEETMNHKIKMTNSVWESDLLIIVDSSTNDVKTCKSLSNENIDIVILDHHSVEEENPHVILVNPQQNGCNYPNKNLSGAGVVWKTILVVEDILEKMGLSKQINPFYYIDLVAMGIYADVMKVDNLENRFIISQGMRNIKNTGLLRILKGGNADLFAVRTDDIGFTVAPIINGVCRMEQIKLAINILLEDDDSKCKPIRLKMHKLNEERKVRQKEIAERYRDKLDLTKRVLFVADDQSSSGFNGLIATQLADEFRKCVVVGRLKEGKFSGSFRSYNDFDFKSFLQKFDGEIESLGHSGAGGVIIKEELLEKLHQYFEDNMPSFEDETSDLEYDLEISVSEIDEYMPIMMQVNQLTGNGFPKVLVKVNDITVQDRKVIGKSFDTIKIDTMDNVGLIKFRVNDQWANDVSTFSSIDVIGTLCINKWFHNGLKQWVINNQIMIEDYKCK